jgi:superkiller protein 3
MKRCFLIRVLFFLLFAAAVVCPSLADYKQAVAYYTQGDYNRAIQALRPDLERSPDWEFGHRLLGLSYLNIGNNALAASSLSRAAELGSTTFATYYGLGQAYFNMRRYDDAISALNRSETLAAREKNQEVEGARVHTLRGTAYYRTNRFSEAINDLQRAVRVNSSDWTLFFMLGASHFNINRTDEAIQAFERAVALKPDEASVRDALGRAYLRRGVQALSGNRFQDAIQALLRARTYDPNNGFISYNLGEAHLFERRYAEAERELTAAAARLPSNAGVFTRLGEQALKAYRRAYELSPSHELRETIDRVTGNIRK